MYMYMYVAVQYVTARVLHFSASSCSKEFFLHMKLPVTQHYTCMWVKVCSTYYIKYCIQEIAVTVVSVLVLTRKNISSTRTSPLYNIHN